MIYVLIVADIRLYREGLAQVLARAAQIRIVKTAANVDEALGDVGELRPDVVLLDMASPEALSAVRVISESFPEVKVVALGVDEVEIDVVACAEAGVAGYVLREGSVEDLVTTVESAACGELRCSPHMAATLFRRLAQLAAEQHPDPERAHLTKREREVLRLIDEGLTNKEVASRLYIEVATVKNHVHNIIEKLGVRTRGEAAARMRRSYHQLRRPSDPSLLPK